MASGARDARRRRSLFRRLLLVVREPLAMAAARRALAGAVAGRVCRRRPAELPRARAATRARAHGARLLRAARAGAAARRAVAVDERRAAALARHVPIHRCGALHHGVRGVAPRGAPRPDERLLPDDVRRRRAPRRRDLGHGRRLDGGRVGERRAGCGDAAASGRRLAGSSCGRRRVQRAAARLASADANRASSPASCCSATSAPSSATSTARSATS